MCPKVPLVPTPVWAVRTHLFRTIFLGSSRFWRGFLLHKQLASSCGAEGTLEFSWGANSHACGTPNRTFCPTIVFYIYHIPSECEPTHILLPSPLMALSASLYSIQLLCAAARRRVWPAADFTVDFTAAHYTSSTRWSWPRGWSRERPNLKHLHRPAVPHRRRQGGSPSPPGHTRPQTCPDPPGRGVRA